MSKKLLLADDSVTIQKVVELTFMDEDYEVVTVGDGDTALARLDEFDPDVLIADVHMPGADGYTLCRRAKERRPDLSVLLLAGTFEAFEEEEMRACGADGFLRKPFDSQDLLRRVEELTGGPAPAEAEEEPEPGEELEAEEEPAPAPRLRDRFDETPPPDWGSFEGALDEPEELPSFEVEPAPEEEAEARLAVSEVDEELEVERPILEPGEPEEPEEPEPRRSAAGFAPAAEEPAAPPPSEPTPPASEPPAAPAPAAGDGLSEEDIDRIARRVVELLGQDVVREVAWEVIPDMAEIVVRERLRELEEEVT